MTKFNLWAKILPLSAVLATSLAIASSPTPKELNIAAPHDPVIANHERIIYWLKKRGELSVSASEIETKAALNNYLKRAANQPSPTLSVMKLAMTKLNKASAKVKGIQSTTFSKVDKTVKVLAVLVDFPDLPFDNNRLTSSDTGMFYSNYTVEHYNQLMFSTDTYPGPSNQALMTAHKYYQKESGGGLFFTGTTVGWVTADSNAATYGAYDDENDRKDIDPEELVKQAVIKAVASGNINLADFDLEDPFDRDGDGNITEPDGFIDHLIIFHSSMGEETGGGVLGDDAIWSHRFFVNWTGSFNTMGFSIPGSPIKGFGYTIQPIDAAIGVVVHEFGHDLGLKDEYDTNNSDAGAPTGLWSVMAGGSWVGSIPGTQPTSFSPHSKDFLQQIHGTNWVNQQIIDLSDFAGSEQTIDIVENVNHQGDVNQLKINLPVPQSAFFPPFTGSYQYYSGDGDEKSNRMSFNTQLPAGQELQLKMKAHWNIEEDFDYVQVLANGVVLTGSHTRADNSQFASVHNFITNISKDLPNAQGTEGWQDISFDLSAFSNQSVEITFQYITDQSVGGYGFVADDINIMVDNNQTFTDGAEQAGTAQLNGFNRIQDTVDGKPQNYYVQLRSHNDIENGMNLRGYKTGMLVWFADEAFEDNHVDEHPGHGFIGVVDANQNTVMNGNSPSPTTVQIRDATFGLFSQNTSAEFDDSADYSSPAQPQSGLILPQNGLKITVLEQTATSTSATIRVSAPSTGSVALSADFTSASPDFRVIQFTNTSNGGTGTLSYNWDFGDGSSSTLENPSHTYAASGDFEVTLTVTDEDNTQQNSVQTISIAEILVAQIDDTIPSAGSTITLSASSVGGVNVSYLWDFGDNTDAVTGAQATHTYSLSGDYTVTLTVSSADNQQVVQTLEVSQTVPMNVEIFADIDDLSVTLSMTATGGDGNFTHGWLFGDNTDPSNELSPVHTYAVAGTYTIELQITDGQGQIRIVTMDVTVSSASVAQPPPPASSGGGGGSTGFGFILLGLLAAARKRAR